MREGGLYRLFKNLDEQVWQEAMMEECVPKLEEIVTKMIVELVVDSLITTNGGMEEC